ncbi:hypothetical protein DFH08DRAFT_1082492 [Mycena albidolilacea]|uniref:Uncharacterized protein n=1 Tax=Mycena albidolilacea TaxID=1033008 RepID=A0AAD6ZUL7_9AGAR|nr:hypothetical protein DFH08DRAFT_1082492 [Mycena albidolilacea]
MNFLAALLASFIAVAAANPVSNMVAREPSPLSCHILPFLLCEGGAEQQLACGDAWECPGNGLHPIMSNVTCAAECVCEIPCP